MAKVLTSRGESRSLAEDPRSYAAKEGLLEGEVDVLVEMANDLVKIAPSFHAKREGMLERAPTTTLKLLEDEGHALVHKWADSMPPNDYFAIEIDDFCSFVVDEVEQLAAEFEHGELLVEIARYEQLWTQAFHATRRFGAPRPAHWHPGDPIPVGGHVTLTSGAVLGSFHWDLRQVRQSTPELLATLPRDACHLLFFHNGIDPAVQVQRLRPAVVPAVELIAGTPEGARVGDACAATGTSDADPARVLGPLLAAGALVLS
jgi:hypothetical protein